MNMRMYLVGLCWFLFTNATTTESVYSHTITTIEGDIKPLSAYQGKRLLVITLPVQPTASNDSLLHSLDSLNNSYAGSLVVIATPSYEDGYTPAIKESLRQWYRSILNINILVTEGYHTRKTSGSQQHSLFKWLTDKNKNSHFDNDVIGPRDKFVIWTDGSLIGVLGAQTKLGSSAMNTLLQ